MVKTVERLFAGREYRMETGRLAKQAAGCAVVQHGDTMVSGGQISIADE